MANMKIDEFCKKLSSQPWHRHNQLSQDVIKLANEIFDFSKPLLTKNERCKSCNRLMAGTRVMNDITIISAGIYISAICNGEKRTQKEICDITKACTVSLRRCYRKILDLKGMRNILNLTEFCVLNEIIPVS